MTIDKKLYFRRLELLSPGIREFVTDDKNTSLSAFVRYIKPKNTKPDDIADILKSKLNLLILGMMSVEEYFESFQEILDLEEGEVEKAVAVFLENCLTKDVRDYIETRNPPSGAEISQETGERPTYTSAKPLVHPDEDNTISHVDILNEIENPTPSMNSTQAFSAQKTSIEGSAKTAHVAAKIQPTSNIQTSALNTQTVPEAKPTELGGFSTANHQNPAQKVATKLDQQLTGQTSSIPKEVYVSKKLDPYKEPLA